MRDGKLYRVTEIDQGSLTMGPAPPVIYEDGGWIQSLKAHNITTVVSMLREDESYYLELNGEAESLSKFDIDFRHYPITDLGCPDNEEEFALFLRHLYADVCNGLHIYVHCHAGIGRAGLVSCGLLALNGMPLEEIYDYLEQKRGLKSPQTEGQRVWFIGFAQEYLISP